MKKWMWILIVAIVLAFPASNAQGHEDENFQKHMENIYEHYFAMGELLSQEKLDKVKEHAQDLREIVEALGHSETRLSKEKDREFQKIIRGIEQEIPGLSTEDLKELRKGYAKLSELLIRYLQIFPEENKDYSIFSCGMAKKRWLQKDKEKQNPYLKASMRKCGMDVTEEALKKSALHEQHQH